MARRLEAGDWVVATGEAARVSPGLGKLSDGDYDPADDALLRARVDFAVGPRWIAAADLERVTPEDELALVERALDGGLTTTPRAAPRLAPDAVLPVVLEHLNRTVLLAVAKACEAPIEAVDARRLRAAIVAARPSLARVLDSLTTNQLRRAHADCGLQHGGSLDVASLRAELEALAASGAESTPRGLSDAERAFLETALGTVSLAGLFRIARGMGIDWASRGRGPPARAILDGAPTPGSIVARLEPDELGAACRACGLEPPHEAETLLAALRELAGGAPWSPRAGSS